MKTRVAHVMGKMVGGGVEAVVMNYYRNIDKSQVQFDFIIDSDSTHPPVDEIEQLGGRVYTVPPYQHLREYLPALESLFRENEYKIVHSHINTLSVFPLYAAKRAGVPVRIAHNHSTAGKGETKKNILKYMLRPFAKVNATHYAACSSYAGEWLFGKNAVESGAVTVFNNAIDLPKFCYSEADRRQIRRELDIENRFTVGHIGRFCYQKNHDFLIDIFAEILKKQPDAVLLLAGEGELLGDVRAKVHALGIDSAVRFLGLRSDTERLYCAMDVFVLPSRYEGLPVVGVEAQAEGLPCVFSNAITPEAVMCKTTRVVSTAASAGEWAQAVLSAAGRNPSAQAELAACGFDIAHQAQRLCEFYAVGGAK